MWNFDISAAPRGKTVTVTRKVKTAEGIVDRAVEETRREYILAVHADGTVVQSYWIPPRYTQGGALLDGNRWSGFNVDKEPIAWAPWPEYKREGANELVGGFPVAAAQVNAEETGASELVREQSPQERRSPQVVTAGETASHFILDDCGSGA